MIMSENTEKNIELENIVSLAKRRGFIYPGSDVYGGLSGTWDYGPLGVALKRNIMQLWWKMFVEDREDMYGVDAAILMNRKVWEASGHVNTFTDPIIQDKKTNKNYRLDHLLKDAGVDVDGLSLEDMIKVAAENEIKSPEGNDLGGAGQFNLMFKTITGPQSTSVETNGADSVSIKITTHKGELTNSAADMPEMHQVNSVLVYDFRDLVYLRPETAQGIFTNYKNILDSFYPDLPFGVGQQGKAFRNEISPRDFVFRSREFEQMEIEYFIEEGKWEESFEHWRQQWHAYFNALGLPNESIHELEVPEEDRAHYSKRTVDFEFDYPIGKEELAGLAYRTNFDLMNIQNNSGKSMEYTIKGTNTKFVPHVIEPTIGVERAVMAVMSAAYTEDEVNGEKRIVMKFPEHLAPVKYCVSPLLKNKPELVEKAREVYNILKKKHGAVMWDDNGNIGKRYRRQDEIGTPHCVVIDFDTLEDNTVTVRDRDTTEQTRVNISELS
jgi:glycyl-tRNA synthetase